MLIMVITFDYMSFVCQLNVKSFVPKACSSLMTKGRKLSDQCI